MNDDAMINKIKAVDLEIDEFGRVVIDDHDLLNYVAGAGFEEIDFTDNAACNSNGACGNAGCANVARCRR